jgi:hypothetical protein
MQVEHYTSPFEVKKVETLVANFGHKAKHQTIDKVPDMIPALIVLGITIWYVCAKLVTLVALNDVYCLFISFELLATF